MGKSHEKTDDTPKGETSIRSVKMTAKSKNGKIRENTEKPTTQTRKYAKDKHQIPIIEGERVFILNPSSGSARPQSF